MSKQLKTVHLILIAFIVSGTLFAIDSHYKAVANAEKRALDIAALCFGIRETEISNSGSKVAIKSKCTENTMVLSELRKGRDDT